MLEGASPLSDLSASLCKSEEVITDEPHAEKLARLVLAFQRLTLQLLGINRCKLNISLKLGTLQQAKLLLLWKHVQLQEGYSVPIFIVLFEGVDK